MSAKADNADNLHDYCSGYLSEIYGALDAIDDPLIRSNIEIFLMKILKTQNTLTMIYIMILI